MARFEGRGRRVGIIARALDTVNEFTRKPIARQAIQKRPAAYEAILQINMKQHSRYEATLVPSGPFGFAAQE